ncbi:MAG: hypothetical protein WCF95_00320 [bacterium]
MQIVNKQIKISKTSEISLDYIQKYFDGFEVIRWAIVAVTEDFYLIDSAVILP